MSCLTSGSRLERNAPHLTDDPARGPASSPSSVPPCGQNSLCVEKIFFVNGDGLIGEREALPSQWCCFLRGVFQSPAQFSGRGPTGAPSP